MSSKKRYNPISASLFYTAGNMLIKAIPFLTLPIFTRLLTTEDFGLYNTYLSYETILTIVLGFGFVSTIRMAKVQFKDKIENYVSSIFGLQTILAIAVDAIVFCILAFLVPNFWMSKTLIIILLVNCLSTQIYNIGTAKYAINGEVAKNLIASLVLTFINVGSSILLCLFVFSNETYLGRIVGTCFGAIVVAIIILVFQFKKSFCWHNKEYWLFGLRMGAPLIVHSLSLVILSQSDKIMIQSLIGSSEAGIYGLAVTLAGIVTVIVSSVDNAWAPWFYDNLEKRNYSHITRCNNYMVAAFTALVIGVLLVSPELIKIVSERSYWDSVFSFPPLVVSVLFSFFYLIPVNFEYFHKKTVFIAISTAITATINIALNFVLIRFFGYIGAAYATCASNILLFLMHWIRARNIDKVQIVSILWILACSLFAVGAMLLVLLFNDSVRVRYAFAAEILGVLIIFMKHNNLFANFKTFIHKKK